MLIIIRDPLLPPYWKRQLGNTWLILILMRNPTVFVVSLIPMALILSITVIIIKAGNTHTEENYKVHHNERNEADTILCTASFYILHSPNASRLARCFHKIILITDLITSSLRFKL